MRPAREEPRLPGLPGAARSSSELLLVPPSPQTLRGTADTLIFRPEASGDQGSIFLLCSPCECGCACQFTVV